jgi:hypothetical protein
MSFCPLNNSDWCLSEKERRQQRTSDALHIAALSDFVDHTLSRTDEIMIHHCCYLSVDVLLDPGVRPHHKGHP